MTRFAFVIHPLNVRDLARKFPWAGIVPERILESLSPLIKPSVVSHITGVESITGAKTEGWFIGCPLTPKQMTTSLPLEQVYDKIVGCANLAASEGADLIGLGAFTSVVGDGGITIASRTRIAVTTGNSYTVATAIEGTLKACAMLEMDLSHSTLAVVGATGSIGKTCARILSEKFGKSLVIGRDQERTEALASELPRAEASTDLQSIREADAVITVTSAGKELIVPKFLKPGAVVCDVARPRDVSVRVAKERPDVLVIEGGVVRVPGKDVNFGFEFGFPAGTAYACMSETMMLALESDESKFSFTLGKDVLVSQVEEISRMAVKHGFKLDGFRSFERAVDEPTILRAKRARILSPSIARASTTS